MAASKDKKVTEESIEKKLMSFNNTQDSVQAMSLWIMHNKSHHQKIVDTWLRVLKRSEAKHKLTLFYLCNDVVQHAKKKKALYYLENFKDNLREAVHVVREIERIKPNINRIFKIWEERRTYDLKFINELRKIMENEAGETSSKNSSANATPRTPAGVSPVQYKPSPKLEQKEPKTKAKEIKTKEEDPEEDTEERMAEFKPSTFLEEVSSLRSIETDVGARTKQLTTLRIDATNAEAVKQLKDRSHGKEFCKQFEESCVKIEDYVAMLEKEIKQRRYVLSFCADAEAFYDEQFKEAKIVANAYKNFGARITNMKKRVDDMKKIIPATPSPVPSPSADAPSPGNTPPLQDMDDNDMVDMDLCEEDAEASKEPETGNTLPHRMAYTAMVKSIAEPIPSVTNIVMGQQDTSPPEQYNPAKPKTPPPTDTFQGSNILESRIATMLPNLAKGNSSLGLTMGQPPASSILDNYVPPKPERQENTDDRSSTPVLDEQEDKEPLTPQKPAPTTKASAPKVKTNPIDFLSQLLTKSSNTSSSSNFLHSLSLLTNTVKTQYDKKKEDEGGDSKSQQSLDTAQEQKPPVTFAGVPPPEPMPQASTWSSWKPVGPAPQPPLPQGPEPTSPPTIPPAKTPDLPPQPPPQPHPPLPPEPMMHGQLAPPMYPVQPPSPQDFSLPPPASQKFPVTSMAVSQPYIPPPPISQSFGVPPPMSQPYQTEASTQNYPPVISQAFTGQPNIISPPAQQFSPMFPFGVNQPKSSVAPPPPPSSAVNPQPPGFMPPRQVPAEAAPPHSQSHMQGAFAPPPPPENNWQQEQPPPPPNPLPQSSYGNHISPVQSLGTEWDTHSYQDDNKSWDQEEDDKNMGSGGGYAHPWDQPQNYEDEDETDDMPSEPLPPAPKGILRNSRSSSLREVVLVDDGDKSLPPGHAQAPPQEYRPVGILKKPDIKPPENPSDVQSEFIAKLKQKASSGMEIPPPMSNRNFNNLTAVSTSGNVHPVASQGEVISTIGVIRNSGRTSSVKSDDMDLDNEDSDSTNDAKHHSSFGNNESEQWAEPVKKEPWQEDEMTDAWSNEEPPVSRDYGHGALPPRHHEHHPHPRHPRPYEYEGFRPRGGPWQRPPPPQDFYRGPSPAKRPFFSPRPRMPYYRY